MRRTNRNGTTRHARRAQAAIARKRGSALVSALIVLSVLTAFGLSMLSASVGGTKVLTTQSDDHRLTSAVESVGSLAAQDVWGDYVRAQGGAAGSIDTLRAHLTSVGLAADTNTGAPAAGAGQEWLARLALPTDAQGRTVFDGVTIDGVRVLRRDEQSATRLYVTVQATTRRGLGLASPALARSVQLVYTIEPAPFDGFDYGILANNVNCVFCHTVVDSADRVFSTDPAQYDAFHKVKVGTLESLMLRSDGRPGIGDWDADTRIAGSLYVRGHATNQNGVPIGNWPNQSAKPCVFDAAGNIQQNDDGTVQWTNYVPAGDPPEAGENLYLNYPSEYADMVDGNLPTEFPPPFRDDGGIDPITHAPTSAGAGNRQVDPSEFFAQARAAEGTITSGVITVTDVANPIDTDAEFTSAFHTGNRSNLPSNTTGHVILNGTRDNPIVLNGTVAIDGDVILNGYVRGAGTLLVSGNVYVPCDLQYLDGQVVLQGDDPAYPTGPRTFGVAQDGTRNVLGLACGGNVLIGDYLQPSASLAPGVNDIVTGNPDSPWNFSLAEVSLFNRGEWARTQPMLPGPGDDVNDASTWTVTNPSYEADYVPRYYQFGPGDVIPIYNLGNMYFDTSTGTWVGDAEVPLGWNPDQITMVDPSDTTNPILYDPDTGAPRAAVLTLTPSDGWITDALQERAIEEFKAAHAANTPMQIDGLLYTNNAIFGIVGRNSTMKGRLEVNGSLICADLGLLAPGKRAVAGTPAANMVPGSPYLIGLKVNYDKRTKQMLNVDNPNQVVMKRTLWNPTANTL